jgi:hypothetical protein
MAKKAKKAGRPGRESDQFLLRMPNGMRDDLAKLAAHHGRSMNSEVVEALTNHIAGKGFAVLSEEGITAISKRMVDSVEHLDGLLFDVRDIDLDAFIADQRTAGTNLTRQEAIRRIVRSYLQERGYVVTKATQPSTPSTPRSHNELRTLFQEYEAEVIEHLTPTLDAFMDDQRATGAKLEAIKEKLKTLFQERERTLLARFTSTPKNKEAAN